MCVCVCLCVCVETCQLMSLLLSSNGLLTFLLCLHLAQLYSHWPLSRIYFVEILLVVFSSIVLLQKVCFMVLRPPLASYTNHRDLIHFVLVFNKDNQGDDPFRMNETDLKKTRAIDSSLWELQVGSQYEFAHYWKKCADICFCVL